MSDMVVHTLWQGRREQDAKALSVLIPEMGEVDAKKSPALETYRKFANVYYEIFNNGCFNWSHYGPTYRAIAKANGMTPYDAHTMRHCIRNGYDLAELEVLGDIIIDAALVEQGIEKAA